VKPFLRMALQTLVDLYLVTGPSVKSRQ
jgi:hypothetical protein